MSSSEWKTYKLVELGKLARGKSRHRPRDASFLYGGPYPFIQTGDIKSANHKIRRYTQTYSGKGLAQSKLWPEGTIVITIAANIADTAILTFPACFPDSVLGFVANTELCDIEFVEYLLQHYKKQIQSHAVGSVQDNINLGTFENVEFDIPPLPIQKRIAAVLSALDEKIELNRQTNATLEAIAQAIFREWFVNFNYPVLHYDLDDYMRTMRVGGENHSESGNQTNHSTDMVEGEMGLMPAGWRVGTLGEVCEVKGGTTPSTKDETYWNGEHHWATPRDLSNLRSPILLTTERKITKAGVDKISSGILPKGTLLLSSRAPIGYLAIASIPVSINQGFIAINAKKASNLFLLHWLRENMGIVISRANGSTFLEISKTNFRTIQLVVPDVNTIRNFDKVVTPIFEQIENNERESATLAQIRDALLPKLMRGEIV